MSASQALPSRQQGGFTLLELLAAVSLLAIGFFIVFSAMGHATESLVKDNNVTQMALMARTIFDEHARGSLPVGEWQGREADIQWQLRSSLVRNSAPVRLLRLDLTLESHGRQELFSSLRAQSVDQGLAQ